MNEILCFLAKGQLTEFKFFYFDNAIGMSFWQSIFGSIVLPIESLNGFTLETLHAISLMR